MKMIARCFIRSWFQMHWDELFFEQIGFFSHLYIFPEYKGRHSCFLQYFGMSKE